ncbi:ATP-dependent DNA ligase [Rhizobium mongolense]|uniref:DNA ligase (ATP) n=1 Tax=Rhizobium mongolense TaxID=57676 RepID=A0ABR6ISY2_9HYPH|nr:ATP-dependent DNA ligase [Rhizobium mongolense]
MPIDYCGGGVRNQINVSQERCLRRQTKEFVWVQPTLIAEIERRAWTHDEKLRHASYKGLRDL